jgi:hypothetical protein
MQTVRVYDPERHPQNWREIIRPGQVVAFATRLESSAACDAEGTLTLPDAATCIIFDSLAAASAFCRERVEQAATVRFDIFEAAGRASPPLLTIVHPSRATKLEGNRRGARLSNLAAVALILAAPVLLWYDWAKHDGVLVLPTIIGINCVIFAARIFQLNGAYASAERSRRQRVAQHVDQDER